MAKRVAIGWFPAGEFEKALALWPDLVDGWDVHGYAEYCRAVDGQLRRLDLPDGAHVVLAPIEVKYFTAWCAAEGLDSGASESRSLYAMQVATRGRVRPWPPGRNKRCWCGRDQSYGGCCGA